MRGRGSGVKGGICVLLIKCLENAERICVGIAKVTIHIVIFILPIHLLLYGGDIDIFCVQILLCNYLFWKGQGEV